MKNSRLLGRSVGIHGDHRNSGRNRFVDAVFEQSGIGHPEKDAGGFLLHRLIEGVAFGFRIVGVRAHEIGAHFELCRSPGKPAPAVCQ